MKKRSLWLSAAGALVVAVALAGCGTTTYFAGRNLPPSGLTNRVLIAIQNPSASDQGRAADCRRLLRHPLRSYNNINVTFSHLRLFGRASHHHPEHARRAAWRRLRLRRRQLHSHQLCQGNHKRRRIGPERLLLPASSSPATRPTFLRQPAIARAYRGEPDHERSRIRSVCPASTASA